MWKLKYSGQFKKDLKRYKHFPDKIDHLLKVMQYLQADGSVPAEYEPHELRGNYVGFMECHIESDFLLVWLDEQSKQIRLSGSEAIPNYSSCNNHNYSSSPASGKSRMNLFARSYSIHNSAGL